ncbi:MAG: formate--tetrahydrofolate ligase, partial [Clostridia bacterium]|nr:formate--tetrahydrofolate ligase [Clostridia bacterium]
ATIRALKMHGGVKKDQLKAENLDALLAGISNLRRHVSNMQNVYGLPAVVAVNRFPDDTEKEIELLTEELKKQDVNVVLSEVWAKGGEGGIALAEEVVRLCEKENNFAFAYDEKESIQKKLNAIVNRIYGGTKAVLTPEAKKQAKKLTEMGYGELPVCVAKTQYSFSDKPTLLGAPEGFEVTVRNLKVSAGAGFVVALTGEIMTMPGLPKVPAAEAIDVDENGVITGLF